jgi:myosin V
MQVTYKSESFLEKNRDYIVAEHCNLLSSSRCPFVSGLFTSLPEESIRSSYKFSSVASRFKVSIWNSIVHYACSFLLSLRYLFWQHLH